MATAAPVEKDAMQINCCVCNEVFVEPKILPCGHLVCRRCLISWLQTETEARCPVCTYPIVDGQVTCVDDVVDRFPTHLLMADIVKQASLLSNHHVCCVCEDIAAVSLCLTCGDMFCETCCKMHKKQSVSKHHQLESLSSLTADTLAAKKPSMCPIHTNELVQLFCTAHKVPVCVVCATADHRNCPLMVKAENRAQELLAVLTEVAVTLKAGEGKLETAIKEIEESLKALGRQTDKEISDVKAVQQRLEKAVQACCSQLMENTLKRSSISQTSLLDGKAKLQAEKGRYVQHSTIVEQLGTFSVHTDFSDMAETMKKCADSLDCSDAFIASTTVTDKSVTGLDYAAVAHIEEELARISETFAEKSTRQGAQSQPSTSHAKTGGQGRGKIKAEDLKDTTFAEKSTRQGAQSQPSTSLAKTGGQGRGKIKAEDLKDMLPVLRFHERTGRKIKLTNDGLTAERTDREVRGGVVVSRDPMVTNRLYEVKIDAIISIYSPTYVGVVTCSPDTFHIPDCALWSDSPSVLCVTDYTGRAFGQKLKKKWPALNKIAEGSCVGLVLDSSRSLHLYINGQDQGVITSGLPHPCYFMFYLCSRCLKATALPVTPVYGM